MNYDTVKQKNIEYFSRTLQEGKDEHYAVAQSPLSHLKRFAKMLELGDFTGKKILDVGCGLGGFYRYLLERGIPCDYYGVDINPGMIAGAKERNPAIADHFFVFDILEQAFTGEYDYVIAVGPLNLKFAGGQNMELTVRMLKEMYRMARVGVAFSMTSALTRRPNDDTFYYQPAEVVAAVVPFCANIRLDQTFLPHDFVVFCYKQDLYNT